MQVFTKNIVCFITVLIQCQIGNAMLKGLSVDHLVASDADILCVHSDNEQLPMEIFAMKYPYIHQSENLFIASKYPLNLPESPEETAQSHNSLDLFIKDDEECLGHLYFSDVAEQTLCFEYNETYCSVEAVPFLMDDGQSSGLASMFNRKKHLRLPDLSWRVEGGIDRTKDNDGNCGVRADVTYENETKCGTQYEVKSYGEVSTDKEGKTTETVGVRVGING